MYFTLHNIAEVHFALHNTIDYVFGRNASVCVSDELRLLAVFDVPFTVSVATMQPPTGFALT